MDVFFHLRTIERACDGLSIRQRQFIDKLRNLSIFGKRRIPFVFEILRHGGRVSGLLVDSFQIRNDTVAK